MTARPAAVALVTLVVACQLFARPATSAAAPVAPPAKPAAADSAAAPAAEARAVEATLVAWYDAMRAFDLEAVAGALTPSFLLLEAGTPLDGPALVERLRAARGQGSQTAALSDLRTRVRGDVAWTTLRNRETWTPKEGAAVHAEFLETVVLVRDGGRWRIDRYHAERVPEAKR